SVSSTPPAPSSVPPTGWPPCWRATSPEPAVTAESRGAGASGGAAGTAAPAAPASPATPAARGPGLFGAELAVVNVGTAHFADALAARGVRLSHVEWRPPVAGCDLTALWRDDVEAANREALRRVLDAHPVLVDVRPALEVVPGMTPTTVLHAGTPLPSARM